MRRESHEEQKNLSNNKNIFPCSVHCLTTSLLLLHVVYSSHAGVLKKFKATPSLSQEAILGVNASTLRTKYLDFRSLNRREL